MSNFQCGVGTSMAENIPFIHTMSSDIFDTLEHSHTVQEVRTAHRSQFITHSSQNTFRTLP
jgi:hypothetical protein